MRIISALVIVRIALILLFPQIALGAEIQETNETKINLKINETGVIDKIGRLNNFNSLIAYNPNNFNTVLTTDVTIEPEREKVLAKYKNRINPAFLPQGKFIINASAYTAAADECGKSDGITASGLKVREKETLACPREFPFGTKIKIEGMGTYVCQDRGGAIKGNHIDIYMETKSEAFAFGRRNLTAEVVN
jgi:3D (Asp-Asp-Asp) domain-containing protein